jgi:hypothetical protein
MLQKTSIQNKEYFFVTAYALIYCIALIGVFGFQYKPWTDEEHFYFTILKFIKHPTLYTLKHYEEMSGPLPFILYGIWGKIFNSDLSTLRIFSLLLSVLTILSAYHLFRTAKLSIIASAVSILILSLNPYFIGTSFFVYTDMLCELCLIWSCIALLNKNILISCSALLFAILCRQYMVFFIPVIFFFMFAEEQLKINRALIKKSLFLFIPVIGTCLLFWFWGGASPENQLKGLYINHAFAFHGNAITAYMATSILYTFPLLLLSLIEIKKTWAFTVAAISIIWYYIFPVQGSPVAMESTLHIDTIGLFHKITHSLPTAVETMIWFLLFLCASMVFVLLAKKVISRLYPIQAVVLSSWGFFLLTMSLSYLTWEKYLLPVLPFLLIYGGSVLDDFLSKNLYRIRK